MALPRKSQIYFELPAGHPNSVNVLLNIWEKPGSTQHPARLGRKRFHKVLPMSKAENSNRQYILWFLIALIIALIPWLVLS